MLKRILTKLRRELPPDFEPLHTGIVKRVRPFTMTTPERVFSLVEAVRYVVRGGVPGSIVECGVWKGGSMMAAALALEAERALDRDLWLFDTYDGMPAPTDADIELDGTPAERQYREQQRASGGSDWCAANMDEVRRNLARVGYPAERIHLVAGKVEDTIPEAAPATIAILRLDTDWYESTRHTLEHLYPRLVSGGVLIVDDYGHWKGSRQATDEYFGSTGQRILLNRIDYTGRIGVKP